MRMEDQPAISVAAPRAGRGILPACIAVALFAALSFYSAVRSEGFIAADACTHYLAARYAFSNPLNFVDVWNRPLVTALFAGPAVLGGRLAVRVVCMLVAIGCGVVSLHIARGQGAALPVLALIFTLGQPLLFVHSFGEMTELPFALLLGCAFLAWQRRRFTLAAILVAWTPLARPEGFGFVAIAAAGLALYRKEWRVLLLPIPLVLWSFAGWSLSHHAHPWYRWLADSWPYSQKSLYGSGYLLTFVALLPAVVSPLALPATLIGVWKSIASLARLRPEEKPHPKICVALTALLPLFVLAVHSLLFWLGKMASFGEARYLLVVAPLWGVLAMRGWEWAFWRLNWRHPVRWAAAAMLVPLAINFVHPVVPVQLSHDWQSSREMAAWYRSCSSMDGEPRPLMASHPGVFYFLDKDPHASVMLGNASLHNAPAGALLIWDPVFSETNASADCTLTLDQIPGAGWRELPAPRLYEPNADMLRLATRDPKDPRSYWHVFSRDLPANSRASKFPAISP